MRSNKTTLAGCAGFTLVELMVALAIMVILASLAGPSFSEFLANQRIKNAATDLFTSLLRTRSEAILRATDIQLAQKSGGWEAGWQITNPSDTSTVIEDHTALSGITVSGAPTSVTYRYTGRITTTATVQFSFSSPSVTGGERCVSIDLSGRPVITKAACS